MANPRPLSVSRSLAPPVEGWDTRESLADMPLKRAVVMDNWFPETEQVTVRRGNSVHATGLGAAVEALIEYHPNDGGDELFGATSAGNIYDVTASGAVGAAVSSGHTNGRWQYVNIGTSAGQFVRLVNGVDTPLIYDGVTWGTSPAITGPTAANLIWINIHQNRLWFGEEDSLDAWYLAADAVGGAATKFPLGGVFHQGGYVMTMATWTRDAGDGMDDVACFITSEGEVAVYQGTDPASATTWSLIGNFHIGKPIGRRCYVQAGADLIFVTQDGFVPLSAILTMDRAQAERVALSKQISKAVNEAVRSYGGNFGWQAAIYPRGLQLIFNIPLSTTVSQQYVFNTLTGAPCRFTGLAVQCLGGANDNMYWGDSSGYVYQWDNGASDNPASVETPIYADCSQAFSYFRMPGRNKLFKLIEVIFESNGQPNASVDMNVDFRIAAPSALPVASQAGTTPALWGIAKWGVGIWGSSSQIYDGWRAISGRGRAGSPRVRVSTTAARPSWVSTNITFIPGGYL